MHRVELRHHFETAHRLSTPGSPVKCRSIHGHSWWVTVELEGPELDPDGMLVEFGAFKRAWRGWIDEHLDHRLVLREGDPMIEAILGVDPESRLLVLPTNPTTEALAELLYRRAEAALDEVRGPVAARVRRVHVQETEVNAASYEA